MTHRPPYMFKQKENVPSLVALFERKEITLPDLLDALVTRVSWEHRGVTGDANWSGDNTWGTIWEAYRKGVFTPEEYLFITSGYEEKVEKV